MDDKELLAVLARPEASAGKRSSQVLFGRVVDVSGSTELPTSSESDSDVPAAV